MSGIVWWTPVRRAALLDLVRGGTSHAEAARKISNRFHRRVTPGAVQQICLAAGVRRSPGGRPRGKRFAAKGTKNGVLTDLPPESTMPGLSRSERKGMDVKRL